MADLLLDTCAMIWIGNGDKIADPARQSIEACLEDGDDIAVSALSAWELGVLVSRARLRLPMSPEDWFSRFCAHGGARVAEATPEVLVASSFLPGLPPKDPADRIIIATARAAGMAIVTRDRFILNYANDGNVQAIAC